MAISQQDEQQLTRIAQQYVNGKKLTPPDHGAPTESYPSDKQGMEAAIKSLRDQRIALQLYNAQVPTEVATLVTDMYRDTDQTADARVGELELAYKQIYKQLSDKRDAGSNDAKRRNEADARRRSIPNPWA